MTRDFTLWLEFENWDEREIDDPEVDFFNMQITLANGTKYALNVWTFGYVNRAADECNRTAENLQGQFLWPPDLLVARCWDRQLCEDVVAELIEKSALRDDWIIQEDES